MPVIQTLTGHPYLALRLRLAGIVTVVDAVNGLATLDTHEEARAVRRALPTAFC